MQISHLGHAAVLVEAADQRILIDPGVFSDRWHDLTDLDAVLVTHQHPDHLDAQPLSRLLRANPDAVVRIEAEALATVDDGLFEDRAGALQVGEEVVVGEVRVNAVGGRHAVIHRDLPAIGNVGLVVSAPHEPTFFHPGDALDALPSGVDVLAVPAFTPWAAMKEVIDFARAIGARTGFPMHEGGVNDVGFGLVLDRVGAMSDTALLDLRHGQPHHF